MNIPEISSETAMQWIKIIGAAGSITEIGIHPAAINDVPRTIYQDGWNAASIQSADNLQVFVDTATSDIEHWKYAVWLIMEDHVFFYIKDKKPHISVNCNDLFMWACADSEETNPEDWEELYKLAIMFDADGPSAWAIRKRGTPPQKPAVTDRLTAAMEYVNGSARDS